ncbi:MAG: protein-glutamate O-methyltransferase CheR [Proteobacteria bacterium]|nr:MAG: protein-glutamate O-methyltransferase CheR [Pseudomonadota bacterium]
MQPNILAFFSKYIEKELGIVYSEFNHFQLQNRLEEITKILGLNGPQELFELAQKPLPPTVKQLILDIATNNETSFFRDPRLFKGVESLLLPMLADKGKAGAPCRIWSAACSTGQEPYSLAMLLDQYEEKHKQKIHAQITATDISARVLERARAGRYTQLEAQRGLPMPLLLKYMQKDAESFWTIAPALKSRITFEARNLLQPFDAMGKFDIIFCRNVLIYQSVPSKIQIIKRLSEALRPDGYLVLGAGESLIGLSEAFENRKTEEAIVYQLKPAAAKAAA